MLVPLNWLREYVEIDVAPARLAELFDLTGTEVERIQATGEELDGVVVGRILKLYPHPNADKLVLADVTTGTGELDTAELHIVCGAKNMAEGDKVAVVVPGATLPDGTVIKEANIRGEVSQGMMCSVRELGIGDEHEGILILPADAPVGGSVSEHLGFKDVVLDLAVTPNRPDELGMIGVAREVSAILGKSLVKPTVSVEEGDKAVHTEAEIRILDPDLCHRYVGRMIEGVKVGPSPLWMARRLEAAGIRPINNVVDVTNYVMLETGQPLHAFDYSRLADATIIVRRARQGEILTTLDGVARDLTPDTLLITDPSGPIAMAGVMGGENSEVSGETTTVLLESANFDPVSIARTSRKLGMNSEASMRFERGVDVGGAASAADRAIQLIKEVAGGDILAGSIDVYPEAAPPLEVLMRPARVNKVLGTQIEASEMADILRRLGFEVGQEREPSGELKFQVTVPTFRPDVSREADLIEEVGRIFGFNLVISSLPEESDKRGRLSVAQKKSREMREILAGAGLFETMTYSMVDPKDLDRLSLPADSPLRKAVGLSNPISEEQSIMRTTLLPGIIRAIQHNANRDEPNVQLFEWGRVFFDEVGRELPREETVLGIGLAGTWRESSWYEAAAPPVDLFDLKGILEMLFERLDVSWWTRSSSLPFYHPGKQAEVGGGDRSFGSFGELHPEVLAAFDIAGPIVAGQFEVDRIIASAQQRRVAEIPRFPGIRLDLAVVVDESVTAAAVEEVIRKAAGELLTDVRLFDLYRGGQVPEGKKSMAYGLFYQADRTLTDSEVAGVQERVVGELKKTLGATIRG